VRLAGSSGANPFACIAAGVACLWGPAHGGASEAAFKMLMEIGTVENIPKFIARAKDKNDPFRLMGFGHRVYKNYDPRAKIMQKTCQDVLNELGIKDSPLLDVAIELEKIALSDEYFIEKKLYPNIDFYAGIMTECCNAFSCSFSRCPPLGVADRSPHKAARESAFAVFEKLAEPWPGARPRRTSSPSSSTSASRRPSSSNGQETCTGRETRTRMSRFIRQHLAKFDKLFPALARTARRRVFLALSAVPAVSDLRSEKHAKKPTSAG